MKKNLTLACAIAAPFFFSQTAFAGFDYFKTDGSFKRFSISAGVLHAAPQGDPNSLQNSSAIKDGKVATNGSVKVKTVRDIIDPDQSELDIFRVKAGLIAIGATPPFKGENTDLSNTLIGDITGDLSGTVKLGGLENFSSPGTGLKADDATTVGLLINYHLTDNWSIETKAGFPPKVDILGVGQAFAPITGTVKAGGVGKFALPEFKIKKNQYITNLEQGDGVAARARAWLPAVELHYQFGKTGVNKFRPYVGLGVIYAYFNGIELNPGIRNDLEIAGHQIQNINNKRAGAALEIRDDDTGVVVEKNLSDSRINVEVDASDSFAPIATLGATYDFNDKWFAAASVSYAKLSSENTITVKNDAGQELIRSGTTIDIDPIISYFGIGYRF